MYIWTDTPVSARPAAIAECDICAWHNNKREGPLMTYFGNTATVTTSLLAFAVVTGAPPVGTERTPNLNNRGDVDTAYTYIGSSKCAMCHIKQYKSMLESPKSRSWEALVPGASQQVKTAAGLDVETDYRLDGRCLGCHSVGYGKPGGYAIPNAMDRRSVELAAKREGVGCESCHGPGSGFVKIMRKVWMEERKYKAEEMRAKGRQTVGPEVCRTCHNDQAICMVGADANQPAANGTDGLHEDRPWLDVDVADRHGFHAAFPLKYRIPEEDAQDKLPDSRPSTDGIRPD